MSADPQLPEGTDHLVEGAGAGDDDAFAEETMFTPDEDPDEDDVAPEIAGESGPTASPGDAGRTTGAGIGDAPAGKPGEAGTANFFASIDAWRTDGYDKARDYAQAGLDRATGAFDEVVRMINDAADQIDDKVGAQYGDYARRAADGLGSFGDTVKGKDVDQLFADARDLVRKSPGVAIGAAAALGFVVARLARAGLDAADGASKPKPAA